MNKHLFIVAILILFIFVFTACNQSVAYSEKYEGIPIYPGVELEDSSAHTECYTLQDFNGTLEEVNNFYLEHINREIWSIKTSTPYDNENIRPGALQTQKYILKDNEREVSLILQRSVNNEDGSGSLSIIINGAPFEEAKYNVRGKSNHWIASIEYMFTKEKVIINGSAQYIGTNLPNDVEYEFIYYVIDDNVMNQNESTSKKGKLTGSNIKLNGWDDRKYELEIYKKAINNAYIEIKWREQDKDIIEKIDLNCQGDGSD